jgi:hypothetical protein
MRGEERQQAKLFSYGSPEQRIPPNGASLLCVARSWPSPWWRRRPQLRKWNRATT